jgi:formamidopyrimidine-DNA glycosylase
VSLNPTLKSGIPDGMAVTVDYLEAAFAKRPKALAKAFLIDQERIGGIGNAYSDEILWRAKISPKSLVGKLPPEAIKALAEAIPAVLNEAIAEIRKRRPNAVSGEVRDFLKVHGPGLKVSPTGGRIIKEQVQSKITYYTDEQKLYS